MTPIHIDFETRSNVDLKTATAHKYALDPSTDVWCMAYAIGDEPVKLWKLGEPFPYLLRMVDLTHYYFIAHNAHFELTIWNHLCVRKYKWPALDSKKTFCTMAMAYAMSLPGSLENAALAVGMTERKDLDGRRLMMQMAAPRRENADGTFEWWDDEARKNRLYDYCKNDVIVERELEKRLRPLSKEERKVWLLDYQINERGVQVDTPALKKALTTIASEKERLDTAMFQTTKAMVPGATSLVDLRTFIELHRIKVESLDKPAVRALLSTDLPPAVRQALSIRQEAAKSSTAKLKAMLESASPDGRVRGILQYHGAGTGRWAGRKIQPQNLPRGELNLSQEDIEDVIHHIDDPRYVSVFYGPPLTVISDCVRSFIVPKTGHDFLVADFSSIEARVLAWLAGQDDVLDVFRAGRDIYKVAAASIFGNDYESITKTQRAVGKVAILALGYQGGVGAFQTMAKGYNVEMAPAYGALVEATSEFEFNKARALFERYAKRHENDPNRISAQEYIASDLTKQLWRAANPHICEYWWNLEGAAMAAIRDPKTRYTVKIPGNLPHRQVTYIKSGSFLWCILPSGRKLCYPYPTIREIIPPWNDEDDKSTKPALHYMGVDSKTRQWGKQIAYGGLLAENITQAVARDFLVNALFLAEQAGYPVTFHVHDEIVCEVPKEFGSVNELEQLIAQRPDWGFDCPIAAEGWRGDRYRK